MLIRLFCLLFSVWQNKEHRHTSHDDHDAKELLLRDGLMKQQIGEGTTHEATSGMSS